MLFAVAVGILWSFTGIFYQKINSCKLDIYRVWISCALISILFAVLSGITDLPGLCSGRIPLPPAGYIIFFLCAGTLNLSGSLTMFHALRRGNPGTAWAIGQSALIVPLIALAIWYKEPLPTHNLIGITLIIAGIAAMAGDKKNGENPTQRAGIYLAILAFCITGSAGTMVASSGYFTYNDCGNLRTVLTLSGYALSALIWKVAARDFNFKLSKAALKIIALMSLSTCAGLFLQFKALDHLAARQSGGIFFPLAIGVCIAGFTLYTIVIKHERYSKCATAGLAAVICGIIAISNVIKLLF